VHAIVKNLNPKNSTGYDLITGKILQELPVVGIQYLTTIFNAVMLTGHNGTKSTHITFTTRRETYPAIHINNVQLPQAEEAKNLGLHLDHRLTWRNHIFAKRKQLGITLTKMYWLLGCQSKLTTSTKLLAYKVVLNPFGPMVCNFGARPPLLTSKSSKDSSQRLYVR
jgi:hypothetical protein